MNFGANEAANEESGRDGAKRDDGLKKLAIWSLLPYCLPGLCQDDSPLTGGIRSLKGVDGRNKEK